MTKSVVLCVVSMTVAAAISAAVTAQAQRPGANQPQIISGDDIGFRVEGQRRETRTDQETGRRTTVDVAIGQFLVRINGQWVEAHASAGVRPLTN
jgi:hypothetical protein